MVRTSKYVRTTVFAPFQERCEHMSSPLAIRLVASRKELGLTQDAFCAKIGMPLSTLKKYEGSHREPGSDALVMIAKAGINVHWLLTGVGAMLVSEASEAAPAPAPQVVTKINVDALIAAFVGMTQAAPPGQTATQTARKAIEFYMYLLERGMITPDGIGDGDLSNAA